MSYTQSREQLLWTPTLLMNALFLAAEIKINVLSRNVAVEEVLLFLFSSLSTLLVLGQFHLVIRKQRKQWIF